MITWQRVSVRYIVDDVDARRLLHAPARFHLVTHPAPSFAMLSRRAAAGTVRARAGRAAAQAMPDGRDPNRWLEPLLS